MEVYMAIYKGLNHEQKGDVENGNSNTDDALWRSRQAL